MSWISRVFCALCSMFPRIAAKKSLIALRGDQFLRERLLELRQAAFREQRVIAVHLGEERLLRGDGEDLRGRDRERLCGALHLARNLSLDLVGALELVPQAVDLVQDDE